jgi:DNA repair exonuclease SbcCD ATPase subunit
MAAGDEYLSLVGKDGLNELEIAKKSAQELGNIVVDVNSKVAALYGKFKDTKSMKEFNKQYEEARKLVDDLNASTKAYEKSLADEAKQKYLNEKADKAASAAAREKLKLAQDLKKQQDDILKQQKKEEEQLKRNTSAYDKLRKVQSEAAKAALDLGATLGKDSKEFKDAAANAKKLNDELLELEVAVGRSQRNVGNYKSAFNGLQNSINQISRELPAFTNSLQTGFLAISNNIPMLIDEMKRLRIVNEELRLSGQATIPVWKQMVKGIFSWQTALSVGITLLTLYGKDVIDFFFKLGDASVKASDGTKILTGETKILSEVYKNAATTYSKAASEIDILKTRFFDAKATVQDKTEVVKVLNKNYEDTIGRINGINEAEEFFINRSEPFVRSLMLRAQIEGAYQTIAENTNTLLKQQATTVEDNVGTFQKINSYLVAFSKSRNLSQKQIDEEYEKQINASAKRNTANVESAVERSNNVIKKFILDTGKELSQLNEQFGFGEGKKEKSTAATDTVNEEINLQERLNKALAEKRKIDLEDSINKNLAIIDDDTNSLDARLDAIVQYFESKRALNNIDMNSELSSIQYKLDKITEIEAKSANKRTKQERALLREKEVLEAEKTAIVAKYAIKEADITADANKKEKAAVDKAITDAEKAEKLKQDNLAAIRIDAGKKWKKFQEDEFKAEQKKTQERIKLLGQLRDAANQIFGAIEDISQNKFERDMERLNMQEEAIDRETQVKLNALEKQGLSEEEYDQRKAEIEARADQRKQLLAQNEAARQERQADFEKGMAILKATLALYIGIAQEIEKGGVIGIATGAAVAAYMATVIATLASTPTPQYGDGTPIGGHKGGDAIIGERYEPEQVTLPSGQQYIVSTPTYVKNLPVGTDVTPLSHMVGYKGRPVARGQYGDAQALVNAVENGVSKGLSKQPVHKTVLTNNGLRYVVKNGNTQTTYFNANNA